MSCCLLLVATWLPQAHSLIPLHAAPIVTPVILIGINDIPSYSYHGETYWSCDVYPYGLSAAFLGLSHAVETKVATFNRAPFSFQRACPFLDISVRLGVFLSERNHLPHSMCTRKHRRHSLSLQGIWPSFGHPNPQ